MLSGLHLAKPFLESGITQEQIDAVLGAPVGLPPTGLYGLIDLIGLDVMELVGRNLAANLPKDDLGHPYTSFPSAEQNMHDSGQLGRKSGGFYCKSSSQMETDGKKASISKAPNGAQLSLPICTQFPRSWGTSCLTTLLKVNSPGKSLAELCNTLQG